VCAFPLFFALVLETFPSFFALVLDAGKT